jgi:hypothetical protein
MLQAGRAQPWPCPNCSTTQLLQYVGFEDNAFYLVMVQLPVHATTAA